MSIPRYPPHGSANSQHNPCRANTDDIPDCRQLENLAGCGKTSGLAQSWEGHDFRDRGKKVDFGKTGKGTSFRGCGKSRECMRHRGRAALQRRVSGLESMRASAPVVAFVAAKNLSCDLFHSCRTSFRFARASAPELCCLRPRLPQTATDLAAQPTLNRHCTHWPPLHRHS
jgi:hypothetical protein